MRPVLLSASASLAVCLGYAGAGPITELMRGETEKPAPVFGIPNQLKPSGTVEGIRARNQKPDRKQATSQLGGERACHRLCIRCAHLSGN